jgi:hypothetical protein
MAQIIMVTMVAIITTGMVDIITTTIIITEGEELPPMLIQAAETDMAVQLATTTEEEEVIPILLTIHQETAILMEVPDLHLIPETQITLQQDQTQQILIRNRLSQREIIQTHNHLLLSGPTLQARALPVHPHLMVEEAMVAVAAVAAVEDHQAVVEEDKVL